MHGVDASSFRYLQYSDAQADVHDAKRYAGFENRDGHTSLPTCRSTVYVLDAWVEHCLHWCLIYADVCSIRSNADESDCHRDAKLSSACVYRLYTAAFVAVFRYNVYSDLYSGWPSTG